MKILIIGSGGREHALAWKLAQSSPNPQLFAAPGNAGLAACGGTGDELAERVPIEAEDLEGLRDFALEEEIDLTVVGPEVPLAMGIVDLFQSSGLRIFGPTKAAAQIEASKVFAKKFMRDVGIPTGGFEVFDDYEQALAYLRKQDRPLVVKADGLAAGKGSIVCDTQEEAEDALRLIMVERKFGSAGDRVLIEERLYGEEASCLAFSDGEHIALFPPTQDHKPAYDGGRGPNTGGMGCYAPAPVVTPELQEEIRRTILEPAIRGLAQRGTPYQGVLYAGVIITEEGPKVLEFNCRFGDPETQPQVPLLDSDLLPILEACVDGRLEEVEVSWRSGAAVCVILASGGYPTSYETGKPITGLDRITDPQATVFHAGTACRDGNLVTDGGRVLGVTSWDADIERAIDLAYQQVRKIHFEKMHYRTDIGAKALRSACLPAHPCLIGYRQTGEE
ncbi:MAG: phosphoribosylamine--glycine ligase [Chloroflexota bacterium]|nr:phosphoribosylamine--glycine ligase [Chloroflexota bacterium]